MSITPRKRAAKAASTGRRRRRRWLILSSAAVLIVTFGTITAELLVFPRQGMPDRVDAIVMFNGPGDRLDTTLNLGWERRAPMIVISRGSKYWGHGSICAPRITGVTFVCFDPSPATTQGETEFFARLASRYHWKTVAMVTVTPQITPGRIWLDRCLKGVTIYAVAAPMRWWQWPLMIAYEWGAVLNAELVHRSC